MTKALIFSSSMSPSLNLSEQLKQSVDREEKSYQQLVDDFQRLVRRLEENDRAIVERLKVVEQIRDETSKVNELFSMRDGLESQLWQSIFEMSSEMEQRPYPIVLLNDEKTVGDEDPLERQQWK